MTYSEANNIKPLDSGTEQGLLQVHARRWVAHALRTPKLLKAFSKALFKQKVNGVGVGAWLAVVDSWCQILCS